MMAGRRRRPLPPGRFGLPWLGETLAIVKSNHGFYKDRVAAYGPIFKTRLFGNDFVIFSGHEAFHTFATDPRIVRGDADPVSAEQIFLHSLALIDGEEHHLRKAIMLRAVGYRSAIGSYLPRMQDLMQQTVDRWTSSGTADVKDDLQRFAARLTAALYTGDESDAAVQELDERLADMREAFMTLPIPIPGTTYGKAIAGRKRIDRLIEEALRRHLDGTYDDIVSRMITAAQEAGVPVDDLRGDIRHLMFAGQGGFFVPLTLTTMILGQRPDIMARARAEVAAISPDGPVTMDQIERMEYLEQISKEVRRYFAMNSATFFGRVTDEMEVGGFRIPQGWGAIGAIHVNMRSPEVFDDPERFDPDRFEPAREAALEPGSYVPHGDGQATHHRCPGENIVTVATKLYLTLLLRQATWSIPDQDLTLTNELFPLPASGLRATFTRGVTATVGE